jgi:hypothetical protein
MKIPKDILVILKEIEKYFYLFRNFESTKLSPYEKKLEFLKQNKKRSVSEEWLFELIEKGSILGQAECSDLISFMDIKQQALMNPNIDLDILETLNKFQSVYRDLCYCVGGKYDAVVGYYPEDGYMEWHTNCDAPGLGILFSWSDSGNGYFHYYNDKTKNFEKYQDNFGWNVKGCYMKDKLEGLETGNSWHCVNTNCERFTLGFLLSNSGKDVEFAYDTMSEFELEETPNKTWI